MSQKYYCRMSALPGAKAKGKFPVQSTHLYFAARHKMDAVHAGRHIVQGAQGKTMDEVSEIFVVDRDDVLRLLRHDAEGWADTMDEPGQRRAPLLYSERLFRAYVKKLDIDGIISFHEPAAGIKI